MRPTFRLKTDHRRRSALGPETAGLTGSTDFPFIRAHKIRRRDVASKRLRLRLARRCPGFRLRPVHRNAAVGVNQRSVNRVSQFVAEAVVATDWRKEPAAWLRPPAPGRHPVSPCRAAAPLSRLSITTWEVGRDGPRACPAVGAGARAADGASPSWRASPTGSELPSVL